MNDYPRQLPYSRRVAPLKPGVGEAVPEGQNPGAGFLSSLRLSAVREDLRLKSSARTGPVGVTQVEMAELLTRALAPGSIGERRFRDLERLNAPWPMHVADAYADLLGLEDPERHRFYAVIGVIPATTGDTVTDADRHHLNVTLRTTPAYMCDGLWDIRIRNQPMAELVPDLVPGMNIMDYVLRPEGRAIFPDFEAWADPMLAHLQTARIRAADPAYRADLDRLLNDLLRYPEVERFWDERQRIGFDPVGDKRRLRVPDPSSPDRLGETIHVRLYGMIPPGKQEGWRLMVVTREDRPEQPGRDADPDPGFWFL